MRKTLAFLLGILLAGATSSAVAVTAPELPPFPGITPLEYGSKAIFPGLLWLDDKGAPINAHGGGILEHKGVYYWYGEHKLFGKGGNSAQVGIHVYSSTDLCSWHDEGVALQVKDFPKNFVESLNDPMVKGCVIERPKVMYNKKTNKFVMFFHHEFLGASYGTAAPGFAVSDTPTGPFLYLGTMRPNAQKYPLNMLESTRKEFAEQLSRLKIKAQNKEFANVPKDPVVNVHTDDKTPGNTLSRPGEKSIPDAVGMMQTRKELQEWGKNKAKGREKDDLGFWGRDFEVGQMVRDMNLFVDDDGTAYHIYASEENRVTQIAKLTPDYLGYTGEYIRAFGGMREGPAPFKSGGRYYMFNSACTGWEPNPTRVFSAPSMMGPWKDLGECFKGRPLMSKISYDSQPTYVLPVPGKSGCFIFMGDRWRPKFPGDGRYIWLPVKWQKDGKPYLEWNSHWDFSIFNKPGYCDPNVKK
ncbi:TPA: beta-glucanase [Candidatus Sumerlaeota bacterium]|jgi:hypothetical protein|nr:beta-glucanase [Candidatus Sumerlaeota bacterium]